MTGISPHVSGLYDNRQKMRERMPDAELMPKYFSRHGYWSAGSGKLLHYFIDAASWDEYFPAKAAFHEIRVYGKVLKEAAIRAGYRGVVNVMPWFAATWAMCSGSPSKTQRAMPRAWASGIQFGSLSSSAKQQVILLVAPTGFEPVFQP